MQSFRVYTPTPYDRFLNFCLDADVAWVDFLRDRDERLRLLEVIDDARRKVISIDKKLASQSMKMMSHMIGRNVAKI